MLTLYQNEPTSAFRRLPVYLVDDTDGKTPSTGITVSAGDLKISRNGAAEINHSGTWAEVGNGLYYYEFTAVELGTKGFISLRVIKAGVRIFVGVAEIKDSPVTILDTQGYTAARAPNLDNLNATISSRATPAQVNTEVDNALNTPIPGIPTADSINERIKRLEEDISPARAASLDNLNATISSRSSHTAADVDTQLSGVHGAGSWVDTGVLTQQQVRDSMKLTPTGGAPSPGSIDEHLDNIESDTDAINTRLPSDPADESLQQASHTTTQNAIVGLNNLAIADVQIALTNQGYTAARAPNLDNLDVAISSRSSHTAADVDAQLSGVHGAGSWEAGGGLTEQSIRDAMKLAPSAGAPAVGSIDEHLDQLAVATSPKYKVHQIWVDDPPNNRLEFECFLQADQQLVIPGPTATLEIELFENGIMVFQQIAIAIDANGFFRGVVPGGTFRPTPYNNLIAVAQISEGVNSYRSAIGIASVLS